MSNQNRQAGKGDKPRPVKKSEYNKNYDAINWGNKKKKTDETNNPVGDRK
jgi:hypothetical protein